MPRVSLLRLSTPSCITVCKYKFIFIQVRCASNRPAMTNSYCIPFHLRIFRCENFYGRQYSYWALRICQYMPKRVHRKRNNGPVRQAPYRATRLPNNHGGSSKRNKHRGTRLLPVFFFRVVPLLIFDYATSTRTSKFLSMALDRNAFVLLLSFTRSSHELLAFPSFFMQTL